MDVLCAGIIEIADTVQLGDGTFPIKGGADNGAEDFRAVWKIPYAAGKGFLARLVTMA